MTERAETDLAALLATLSPELQPGRYVYVTVASGVAGYHHEHVLVPIACAEAAMTVLRELLHSS